MRAAGSRMRCSATISGCATGPSSTVIIPNLCLFADRTDVVRRAEEAGGAGRGGDRGVAERGREAKARRGASRGPARRRPGTAKSAGCSRCSSAWCGWWGRRPSWGTRSSISRRIASPDVSFDASLMAGTEEPETFVAIASDRAVTLDAYVVVEVPAALVLSAGGAAAAAIEASGPSSARDVHRSPNESRAAREDAGAARADGGRARRSAGGEGESGAATGRGEGVALVGGRAIAGGRGRVGGARAEESARVGADANRFRELEARAGDEHVRAGGSGTRCAKYARRS